MKKIFFLFFYFLSYNSFTQEVSTPYSEPNEWKSIFFDDF